MADSKERAVRSRRKEITQGIKRQKREPPRPLKTRNTILVHRKSDFKSQLEKCQKLLDSGQNELKIHGLGAAINRAVNLALQLKLRGKGSLELKTTTSTVDLVDDFEALTEEIDPYSKARSVSAIHIILSKIPVEKIVKEEA